MRADVAEIFRFTAEFEVRRASVRVVGGNGNGRQIVFSVRQREAVAEGAVGTQFDFVSAERDLRVRLGRAVDDELGIDVKPEPLRLLHAAKRTGKARAAEGRHAER